MAGTAERWRWRSSYLRTLLYLYFFCIFLFLTSARSAELGRHERRDLLHAPLSGRALRTASVMSHVRKLHPAGPSAHIFELTPDSATLVSSHHRVELSTLTRSRRVTSSLRTEIFVNGRRAQLSDLVGDGAAPYVMVKSNAEGTIEAVYDGDDLIQVWSRHADLAQLHDAPNGIFVASRLTSTGGEPAYPMDNQFIVDALMNETDSPFAMSNDDDGNPPDDANDDARPSPLPPSSASGQNACARGVLHYLEIAVAFDNTLCRFYKNDIRRTLLMINVLFAQASRPYILDTCVRLALVHVDAHCQDKNDPYIPLTKQASVFLALGFNRIWQKEPRASVPRDVVYFISGFNDGTTVLGFGFPGARGGVCDPVRSFGWIEGIVPGVFAHELGHTLSARHVESGLMKAFYEPGPQPPFSKESISEIVTFVDNRQLTFCVEREKPKNAVTVVTALPTPVVLPEYGTCSVSKRMGEVLACTLPRIIGFLRSRQAGTLVVRSWQSHGQFRVDVRPVFFRNDIVITHFSGLQHLNGSFTQVQFPFEDGEVAVSNVSLSRDDERIRWPRPKLTCCDQRLYIFIHIRWCRKSPPSFRHFSHMRRNTQRSFTFRSGLPPNDSRQEAKDNDENCSTMFQRFTRIIPCRSPCYWTRRGKVLPMSKDRQCPACLVDGTPYYHPH